MSKNMSAVSKFDVMLERVLERKVDEYFGSLLDLRKGPVFQVHASMTRTGLTRAVRKTKRSQLAGMKKNEEFLSKMPRGVKIETWHSRWNSCRQQMQRITGYKWRLNNDRENGGIRITRVV
jgi:hypothetical protein